MRCHQRCCVLRIPASPALPRLMQMTNDSPAALTSFDRERVDAGRRDDNVLLATRHVGHGRRVSLRIEAALPKHPAGAGLECAKPLVVGACDEDQAASGSNRSALSEGASVLQ